MIQRILLFTGVAVLGAAAGVLFSLYRGGAFEKPAPVPVTSLVGELRPAYTLGAIDGTRVSAEAFDGDVVLVNFWATWCAPCRKEMPMLAEIQHRYAKEGLSVVGIALDEVDRARQFTEELGITYTILVGAADVMALNAVYGNQSGMLPYTVLIDRQGLVQWTYLGELVEKDLKVRINELL